MMSEFDDKRFGLITGSRVSVLFPKRSAEVGQRTYAKQLANQMFFRFYDETGTWQTQHGKDFEAEAYVYYHENFDKSAVHKPPFMMLDDFGGSADCVCDTHGVDFKCPATLEKWLDYLHVGIDDDQYHQAQMYMFLYQKTEWRVCAFLTETERMTNDGITYPVPQDKRMICVTVNAEDGWVDKLYERAPFVISQRDFYLEKLKEQFKQQ